MLRLPSVRHRTYLNCAGHDAPLSRLDAGVGRSGASLDRGTFSAYVPVREALCAAFNGLNSHHAPPCAGLP
jgi:hypothetical protein